MNGSRPLDHKWSCSPPPSHSTQSLCNLGRNPTHCQVVYSLGSQRCIFFCIPLPKESQYLFAFEWEAPGEKHQQMTWTVLPQGFRDSPHLFGQTLSRDLLDLGPNGKILQYIDDLLICSPDEKSAQQHAIQVLKSPVLRHRWSEFRLHSLGGCPLIGYKEYSSCPPPWLRSNCELSWG